MDLCKFLHPEPAWVSREIPGARLFSPNETPVTFDLPKPGYVLERKVFDRVLTEMASDAGAEIVVKARVTNVTKSDDDTVNGVIFRYSGREYTYKAKIVIAADGVESQVGRWAGIDTTHSLHNVGICAQYLLANIDIEPDYFDLFFGRHVAPRGYVWIFPKGDNIANVGIGISGALSGGRSGKLAIDYLNEFIKRKFPAAQILGIVCGAVPVGEGLPKIIGNGFMLVGDAAHHSDPISGGGIPNAMHSGKFAAEAALEAIRIGDISTKVLNAYPKRWDNEIGKNFKAICRIRDGMYKFTDEDIDRWAEVLCKIPSEEMTLARVFRTVLRHHPNLLLELRHLIFAGWV